VIFSNLVTEQLMEIADKETRMLAKRLAARKIEPELSDGAKALIAKEGFDPAYGARPIKRPNQQLILAPLAEKLLSAEPKRRDGVNGPDRDLDRRAGSRDRGPHRADRRGQARRPHGGARRRRLARSAPSRAREGGAVPARRAREAAGAGDRAAPDRPTGRQAH